MSSRVIETIAEAISDTGVRYANAAPDDHGEYLDECAAAVWRRVRVLLLADHAVEAATGAVFELIDATPEMVESVTEDVRRGLTAALSAAEQEDARA